MVKKTKQATPTHDYIAMVRHLAVCKEKSPSYCRVCYDYYERHLLDWRGNVLKAKEPELAKVRS